MPYCFSNSLSGFTWFISGHISMSVHGLISRELLVSLNALHKHAYIQLNCYIVQFCQACCPSHVFVLHSKIVIFVFVWRMLSLCDVFCFLFLVVDTKISGVGVLLRFCW